MLLPFARERPLSVLPWADDPFDDGPWPGGLAPEAPLRSARLALCLAVRQVLRNGLSLLGVGQPEKM